MGNIKQLKAANVAIAQQEQQNEQFRAQQRYIKWRQEQLERAKKKRKEAKEADELLQKHKLEQRGFEEYKPEDSLKRKKENNDILKSKFQQPTYQYQGPVKDNNSIFNIDGTLNKYDWSKSEKHIPTTPQVQKAVENYKQYQADKQLRYSTTPGRIANMMAEQQDLEEAIAAIGDQDDMNTMSMKEDLKKIKSDIQKEVDWYEATTPKNEQKMSEDAYNAYASGDLGSALFQNIISDQKVANAYEKQLTGKSDIRQNLLSDAFHTFMISKNQVQQQTSLGKIQTLDQQLRLANSQGLDDYQNICEEYIKLNNWLNGVKRRYTNGQGITPEERKQWDPVEKKIAELNKKKQDYEKTFNNLASFENETSIGDLVSNMQYYLHEAKIPFTNKKLYVDFGTGVGGSLKGFGSNITGFQKALAHGDLKTADAYKNKLKSIFNNFQAQGNKMRKLWQEDYDIDTADLNKWQSNYKVSEYFKQREQEANDLTWYNPKKLWMAPSLLGSSLSSPEKTAMSMGAGLSALIGGALLPETGGASVALVAGAVSFLSGMAAGADENFANVADATDEIAKQDLKRKGQAGIFLEDAKRELGNDITEEDALHAFYAGKYVPKNFKIRQTLLDATAGSAKQYYQGMGVNTWDSLVDAIVTCMPMGGIAKSSKVGFLVDKIASKADRKLLKAQLAKYMKDNSVSLKEAVKAIGNTADRTKVSNAINTLREIVNTPANYLRSMTKDVVEKLGLPVLQQKANTLIDKGLAKMAEKSLNHTAGVVDMASAIPERVLKYRSNLRIAGKLAKDLGWRTAASMYSEGAEEGLQQLQQYQRIQERSDAYYNVLNQLPLTIIDGAKLWSTFLFKDPENLTAQERDIIQQMHGGILGALLQGAPNIAVQSGVGTYRAYKADHLILNNLLADNIATNDYLEKARILSQELLKGNYSNIVATLKQYEDLTTNMRNRHKDDAAWAIPGDHVNNLHKLLNTVAVLQQNKDVQRIKNAIFNYEDNTDGVLHKIGNAVADLVTGRKDAKRRKELRKKYNEYIGILAGRLNEIDESKQFLDEKTQNLIASRFDQGTFEDYINRNAADALVSELSTKIEKDKNGTWGLSDQYKDDQDLQLKFKQLQDDYETANVNSESLHNLIGQMQTMNLLQDMEKIKSLPGGKTLLSRVKFEVERTKKAIHEIFGKDVKLDTEEDVKKFAASKGVNINDDYVDALRQVSDGQMQLNFNTEMFNRLLTDTKAAANAVKSYEENKKADEELRQSIEDDFYNNELDRQKFESSEITNNNNTYVKNGKTYVVRDDNDGVRRIYEYDSDNDRLIPTNENFSKREWYDRRKMFDDESKQHEKLRSKYEDYQNLLNKNKDDLTEEEQTRLNVYKQMIDKFNRFDTQEQQHNKYIESAKKAPGLSTDYSSSFNNLAQYASENNYSQDRFDRLAQDLGRISDDGYRTREQKIRQWIENGEKPSYSRSSDTRYIGSHEVSRTEYQYAKWLEKATIETEEIEEQEKQQLELEQPAPEDVDKKPSSTEAKPQPSVKKPYIKPESRFTYHGKPITIEQSRTINAISEYAASNPKYHYEWRTGETYFIDQSGQTKMYKRTHSVLEQQFKNTDEQENAIKQNAKLLQNARDEWQNAIKNNESKEVIQQLKNAYIKQIQDLRDDYYNIAVRLYGEDTIYAQRANINVDGYLQNDDILKSDDTINAVAKMFARNGDDLFEVTGSVISGTIVDDICRQVFSHNTVKYDQSLMMSEDCFNSLIKNIEQERDRLEALGYALITDKVCWYGTVKDKDGNPLNIAGETDMVAIAPNGAITIIDFKTATRSWKTIEQQTGINTTQQYIDAIDKIYRGEFGSRQKLTARQAYTNQLNVYRQLITSCTGATVANIQLLGFCTNIDLSKNRIMLRGINSIEKPVVVDLAIIDPILGEKSYITPHIEQKQDIKFVKQEVDKKLQILNERIEAVGRIMEEIKDPKLINEFENAKDQISKIGDVQSINSVQSLQDVSDWIDKVNNYLDNFNIRIQEALKEQTGQESQKLNVVPESSKFNAPHRVRDAKELEHYNHTAPDPRFLNEKDKKALHVFKDWTTQKDFAQNVQFEIDFEGSKFIHGVATTGPRLKFKSITYNGIQLPPNVVANIAFLWSVDQDVNSLRNRLIQYYNDNYEDIISGKKKVILKNIQRTNGVISYTNQLGNVQERLDLSQQQVSNLLNYDSDAILLISDSAGIIRRLDSDDLKAGSGTAERISRLDVNRNRPGILYIQKQLHYAEDEESTNKPHTALIPMTPGKMSKSAVDLIIDILTNSGKSRNMTAIDDKGNAVLGPINKSLLLHYLIRFGGGAEAMLNNFQFNYENNGQNGLNYNSVFISSDGGKTKTTYNLKDEQDVQKLREWLQKNAYLNVQNTSLVRDNLATSKKGIFTGVKEWFDKHPDIQSIKYTDEFIITRKDVENGIRGIEWMIKNNWLQSQYSGISDAIVSASDFYVIDQDTNNKTAVTEQQDQFKQNIEGQFGPIPEKPQEESNQQSSEVPDVSFEDCDNAWNNLLDPDGSLFMRQTDKPKHAITEKTQMDKAVEDVRRICGDTVLIDTVSELQRKTMYGDVVGQCTASSIMLSYGAENGVQYHEAFHRIVELAMPKEERERLYNIYKTKYAHNTELEDRNVAEGLADMYFEYGKHAWHPKNKILAKLFSKLYNYINALISTKSFKIALTFNRIDYGKYANSKISEENKKRFKEQFGVLNMTLKDNSGKEHVFNHIYTQTQLNDVVDVLTSLIIRSQGIDILGSNIENLKTDKTSLLAKDSRFANIYYQLTCGNLTQKQLNQAVTDGKLSPLSRDNALVLREAFDNWDIVQSKLEDKLKSFGIQAKKDKDEQHTEDRDSGETSQIHDDIEGHSDEFYSHSISDDVSSAMTYMLSTIPNQRYVTQEDVRSGVAKNMYALDKEGKIIMQNGKPKRATIPATRNSLGMTTYLPFKAVHQRLLTELHDVKDVADLLAKLKKLGENDYMFNILANNLESFRNLSYIRFLDEKKYGEYVGFPVVMYRNVILNPSYYISNPKLRNEDTLYPKQVRLVKDMKDKNGNIICKAGDILQGAVLMQDQDKQTLTTQFFQAVKSQKLNFNFFNISRVDGQNGRYEYSYRPTNTDRSQSQLPIGWFDNIRKGLTGLYDQNGNINRTNKIFESTRLFLMSLRNQLINNPNEIKIGTVVYKTQDIADFDSIVSMTITALNNIGIMVNKPMWYNMLHGINPNETDYTLAFRELMTSSKTAGLSIAPLIEEGGVLSKLQKAVDDGDLNIFTKDDAIGNNKSSYSGAYLYARNSFIRNLAVEVGKYRSATSELMTIGAGNTKMYMYAQNNTVSDIVDDLNTSLNEDGSVREGSELGDLQNVEYVVFHDDDGQIHGSIIAKSLLNTDFNKNHNKIIVETEGGSKQQFGSRNSVKFSEMAKREDYLSRMQKLTDGLIIFPTLSDKSTYMSIKGFELPGFDYTQNVTSQSTAIQLASFGTLPFFNKNNGDMIFNIADKYDNYQQNEVLDQFIEYYEAEHRNVLKTLKELGYGPNGEGKLSKEQLIVNYHTKNRNGARYTSIAGIYDEKGNFISFNYKTDSEDGGIIECNNKAEELFFNKPIEEKRAIVARILKHRLDEELQNLVDAGIIQEQQNDSSARLNAKYNNYKNVFLSDDVITRIKQAYLLNDNFKKATKPLNAESLAVIAYVYDMMCKHIMSMEETRRFFTGMPQFFKTSYGENGNLEVFGNDETKRYGGLGSTGTNNREDIPGINENYSVAEINDWETPSPILDSLETLFRNGEYREAVENIKLAELGDNATEEQKKAIYDSVAQMSNKNKKQILKENGIFDTLEAKIKKEAKAFSEVNVADGTAFITDKMCENLLKQRGAFTKAVENAFKILRGNNSDYLHTSQAYKIVHNALISTQKYSAFGYRMENGTPIHYYNKYALFPVFKGIAYGFMRNLYEKMNDIENGVDMVMFTSAVKAGSRGAQQFDPTMTSKQISNFSFKGHIYKQKYKYIRRQLNTDPRTDEIMAAGTQALKVVLSTIRDGQAYNIKDQNGNTVQMSSSDVRDKVMGLLNDIAKKNWDELTNQFFVDGVVDYEKLQDFLIRELKGRNADQNLLDALQLNEDKTGFIVDLNSVSNMAWVESILTSKVNKDVIDLKFKGNAFYQRSVFGMDSPYMRVDEDSLPSSINGGKPLQMINEEGSMDAVVSIDYFMDIIPKEYKYNFKRAKQWLIDNGIISGIKTGEIAWNNAEANTMSYRIPTQAASSIGALRFVDVLPIVRDTIVLPKEFTAQTGSDFDIDKLYMSTLYYETKTENEDYIDKRGNIQRRTKTTAKSYNLQNEKLNKTNELLRTYLSLLKDTGVNVDGKIKGGRYGHILRRSIDSDTDLIKSVLNEIEGDNNGKTYEPYQFETLSQQVNTRSSFATGKTGIGPYALNNNNQILTQLYGIRFIDYGGILSAFKTLRLDRNVDVNGNSILSWISGMINAHVDVAKDPYILRLNINKDTYNLSSLLIRLGFGRHALYFLNNPIMKELAELHNEQDGMVVDDPGKTPTQRKEDAEKQYIKDKFGESSIAYAYINLTKYEKSTFKDLFDDIVQIFGDPMGKKGYRINGNTVLQDIAKNKSLYKDGIKNVVNLSTDPIYDINGKKMSPKEVQEYVYIAAKEFEKYAQALSNLVQYTKIDTKKQGINFEDQQKYLDGYHNLVNSDVFNKNLQNLLRDSYIDTKTMYGTQFLPMVLGRQMIHMTQRFRTEASYILDRINNHSQNARRAVQNAMQCYIKQKAFNKAFASYLDLYNNENGTNYTIQSYWENLIKGSNTLSKRIQKLQKWIQSDTKGVLKEFGQNGVITNAILSHLYPVSYIAQFGQDHYDIITLGNTTEDDSAISNDYIYSWEQMLNYTNQERPNLQKYIRDVANDLAIYAFMTSADSKGFTKFFKYVPLQWRNNFGYCDRIGQAHEEYQYSGTMVSLNNTEDFSIDFDDFIQNFYYDNNILPITNIKTNDGLYKVVISTFTYSSKDEKNNNILREEPKNIFGLGFYKNRYIQRISKNKQGEFPAYIKIRRDSTRYNDGDQFLLYKLVDTGVVKNGNIELEYPVYQIINTKGMQIRVGAQTYQFYSCGIDDNYERSYFTAKDKNGERVKPTIEQAQTAYNARKASLKEYMNKTPMSVLEAVKQAGFMRNVDLINGRLSREQQGVFKGLNTEHEIINVNFGRGEHPELSNFAKRPIADIFDVLNDIISVDKLDVIKSVVKHYAPTVENAFQAIKVLYSDLSNDDKIVVFNSIINADRASEARSKGQKLPFNEQSLKKWDDISDNILEQLMKASFDQNENARQELINTGEKPITHLNAKGESLDNRFAQILTNIRDEYMKSGSDVDFNNIDKNTNEKSLKDYPSNESLDKLADDIDKQCK